MAKTTAITFSTAGIDQSTLSDEGALKVLVRSALETACSAGLEPDLTASNPRERRSVMTHMTDRQAKYVRNLMASQRASVPLAAAVGRLVDAGMSMALAKRAAAGSTDEGDVLSRVLQALGLGEREEQRGLYRYICDALAGSSTGIVAAQASTGIGKTTVAHAVAGEWTKGCLGAKRHSVVVVAFPSLHGVKSFTSQWERARQGGVDLPHVQMLMGRREFVSRNALLELLEGPAEVAPHLMQDDVEAIRAWLEEQDAGGAGSKWYMDSLLERVSALDRESLALNALSSDEDPGVQVYRAQFMGAWTASVIVCTHHMLGFDVMLRQRALARSEGYREEREEIRREFMSDEAKAERAARRQGGGFSETVQEVIARAAIEHEAALLAEGELLQQRRLPPYHHLVVDEAHLLEQAFAGVFSATLSLRETASRLARLAKLNRSKEMSEASAAVLKACTQLTHAGADGETLKFEPNLADEPKFVTALRLILWELSRLKPPKRPKESSLALMAALDRDRSLMEKALDPNATAVRFMEFSPVRHYPQLVMGLGDVSQPMHTLWAGVQSAVMLSATLYMPRSDGWSARYVASLQHVPGHRLREIPVVESLWLTAPVLGLHVPPALASSEEGWPWLMPPSRRHKLDGAALQEAEGQWLDQVAEQLLRIFDTGAGGMLVPCTSHDMVEKLAIRLRGAEGAREHLVVMAAKDFPSLGALRLAAVDAYQAAKRFIMLATGAAWTGFDLSAQSVGQEAAEDNLLTDLVLPRLPFGMNRSITHRRRTENKRDSVNHEVLSVALLVQQALGRLVRRPGLPRNRRIYILDRRFVDGSMAAWMSPVARVVTRYKRIEFER